MATLKISTLNLNSELRGGNVFNVKLDAWKQTFYLWALDASKDIITIDGLNLAAFAHDLANPTKSTGGNGPFVLELGGAFYKGRPIQLDDQLTFTCAKGPESLNCVLLCVKQYFVEDRPGPDKTISDAIQRNIPRRSNTPAGAVGPRPNSNRPGPGRGQYGRAVERRSGER